MTPDLWPQIPAFLGLAVITGFAVGLGFHTAGWLAARLWGR